MSNKFDSIMEAITFAEAGMHEEAAQIMSKCPICGHDIIKVLVCKKVKFLFHEESIGCFIKTDEVCNGI